MGSSVSSETTDQNRNGNVHIQQALNSSKPPVDQSYTPSTPPRNSNSNVFIDPRSPSAPRTPVSNTSSQPSNLMDPRSPLPQDRSPLQPVNSKSSRNGKKAQRKMVVVSKYDSNE